MSTLLGQGNLKELKYRRVCPFCKTKMTRQYNPDNDKEFHWVQDCPKCDFFQWKEYGTWWNATQHIDSKDFHFNEFHDERRKELSGGGLK